MTDYRHGKLDNRIKLQRMHKLKVLNQTLPRRHEDTKKEKTFSALASLRAKAVGVLVVNKESVITEEKLNSHKSTKAQRKDAPLVFWWR